MTSLPLKGSLQPSCTQSPFVFLIEYLKIEQRKKGFNSRVVSNSLSFVCTGRTQQFQFTNPLVFLLETGKKKLNKQGMPTQQTGIRNLHISQMHLVCRPKFCISIVFNSLGMAVTLRRNEKQRLLMQNF